MSVCDHVPVEAMSHWTPDTSSVVAGVRPRREGRNSAVQLPHYAPAARSPISANQYACRYGHAYQKREGRHGDALSAHPCQERRDYRKQ